MTYNQLRIPTSKEYNDLSDTSWEVYYEGDNAFGGGYYDENGEYIITGGRSVISYVKNAGTSYTKYIHVDKETGITYGYEDYGTYYRTIFIMRQYKNIVSPEEYDKLDEASKSMSYSYGNIEQDIKNLCNKRTAFKNFTLTVPEEINAFRLLFSDPYDCVELTGNYTNVYANNAYVYDSGSYINFNWNGESNIIFDRYEIWDFETQTWLVLSYDKDFMFNAYDNPRRDAAYIRLICHQVETPVDPLETYKISVENGYFEIDNEKYYGTIEVEANTLVYVYANKVPDKTFEYWLDANGVEFYDYYFYVSSDLSLTPVYYDTKYYVYYSSWDYESTISVDGGEGNYSGEISGLKGDKFELSTSQSPDSENTVFIGWYLEDYKSGYYDYVLLSNSQSFTYEIKGEVYGTIYAVWTTGENPFTKEYVDIRMTYGFVNEAGGEIETVLDNAYSVISLSHSSRVFFHDDPTDETSYRIWDIAFRYELEGEIIHDTRESYENEYDYYPAEFWVDDPKYSYPDGVINVIGILDDNISDEEVIIDGAGVIVG